MTTRNSKVDTALVLGGGMVGVCTAVHLALRGHRVTLVDRREPGQETSYGNAGIIQREAVEPYAFPREWGMLASVLFKRGAAVNYHWRALPALARGLAGYWANSTPRRHAEISRSYTRLIEHALSEHQPLIDMASAQDLVRRDGYRMLFRSAGLLCEAGEQAQGLEHTHGLRHLVLDTAALAQAEPGLQMRVAGAIQWLDPWTVSDPGELVSRYAKLLLGNGGSIARGDASTLRRSGGQWCVQTDAGEAHANNAVIALGPWSHPLVQSLGYRYPLFVKRGYHRHYLGGSGPVLPTYDVEAGLVLAPMRQGVRLTTGAEFALVDAPATPVQLDRAHALAGQLFTLPQPVEAQPWMGSRPCTADMLPVIGAAPRHPGLWFNFGHAHQGFTLGPVSGRLLAELVDGVAPVVDPAPYAPARFG